MTDKRAVPAGTASFAIEGELTIFRAEELKRAILAMFEQPGAVEIDLSQVTEIDLAGVQLLMLAKLIADGRRRQLRLRRPSDAVATALALLRLGPYFEATSPAADG